MRITIEIDDDVMRAARGIALVKDQPVGRIISDLVRRGLILQALPSVPPEHGIPVWQHGPGAVPVTNELIRRRAEDE